MATAADVNPAPGPGWRTAGAFNFPNMWSMIDKFRPPNFVVSTSIFMAIFFEETACCNMEQQGKPIAIGPGQFQISEDIGVRFFADPRNGLGETYDSSMTLFGVNPNLTVFKRTKPLHPELTQLGNTRILNDNDFSVKMHVMLFRWMSLGYGDGKAKTLPGLLSAQTGNNSTAASGFTACAKAIDNLMLPDPKALPGMSNADWAKYIKKRRTEWIWNLNIARREFRGNPVPEKDHDKFWEFFLPDGFIQSPTGYLAYGF